MLTRFSAVMSITLLTTATTIALGTIPASASGGPGSLPPGGSEARGTQHFPGRPGTPSNGGGGGGGGGGGKAAPMPCPANMACGAATLGNAPQPAVQRVPTIDVAYDARNQLQLPAPHVHTSPAGKTYVQLKTGLWLDRGDFAREEAPAVVPGQTVTAIGTPKSITWNMGEGSVTCQTAGSRRGTACGYTYKRSSADQPNGKYAISVTVTWDIYWTCQGDCDAAQGTYAVPTMSMTTNTALAVGEVQTESRPG